MQPDIFEHHLPTQPRAQIEAHLTASTQLRGFEGAVRNMLRGWVEYADAHEHRYKGKLAEDQLLGAAWLALGHGLLALLNGETGCFDCGSLDRNIRRAMLVAGFTEDEVNT